MKKDLAHISPYISSDVGVCRPNNEDNFLIDKQINEASVAVVNVCFSPIVNDAVWYCFGVFDGMGGGEYGELASLFAAQEFQRLSLLGSLSSGDIDSLARLGFQNANRRIVEQQAYSSMYGTTGTVVFTNGVQFKIYHLGDSRAYLLRDNSLFQLTKDQTVATQKIEAGIYGDDAPQAQYEKHQLIEYIGCDTSLANLKPIESQWIDIQADDMILLCSDGLYDMCTDAEISSIMLEDHNAENVTRRLVEQAVYNGGEDNVTCLIIKYKR